MPIVRNSGSKFFGAPDHWEEYETYKSFANVLHFGDRVSAVNRVRSTYHYDDSGEEKRDTSLSGAVTIELYRLFHMILLFF